MFRSFRPWMYLLGTCLLRSMTIPPVSSTTFELGKRIRDHRHAQGLTQEALADRCKIDATFYGKVERGQRNLRLHNLLKIAAGIGVDPGELIKGMEPPEEDKKA
jgi:ribosome-binding protein aMBF1 (putative translation factor)